MKRKIVTILLGFLLALVGGCQKGGEDLGPVGSEDSEVVNFLKDCEQAFSGEVTKSMEKVAAPMEGEFSLGSSSVGVYNVRRVFTFNKSALLSNKTVRFELEITSRDANTDVFLKLSDDLGDIDFDGYQSGGKRYVFINRSRIRSARYYVTINRTEGKSFSGRINLYATNVGFANQWFLNLKNYVHFSQSQSSNEEIRKHGCGYNTYMLSRYLTKPINAFYPNDNNLIAIKTRGKLQFADVRTLHYLATGHITTIKGYQDTHGGSSCIQGSGNRCLKGDLGRCIKEDCEQTQRENQHQTKGTRYFPQPDFNYTSGDREAFKNFIKEALSNGKSIVLPVRVSGTTIVRSGGIGHFVLVVGLDLTSYGGSSRAYIKDGLTKNSRTIPIDYTKLLDSCYNNANNYYGLYLVWVN